MYGKDSGITAGAQVDSDTWHVHSKSIQMRGVKEGECEGWRFLLNYAGKSGKC